MPPVTTWIMNRCLGGMWPRESLEGLRRDLVLLDPVVKWASLNFPFSWRMPQFKGPGTDLTPACACAFDLQALREKCSCSPGLRSVIQGQRASLFTSAVVTLTMFGDKRKVSSFQFSIFSQLLMQLWTSMAFMVFKLELDFNSACKWSTSAEITGMWGRGHL